MKPSTAIAVFLMLGFAAAPAGAARKKASAAPPPPPAAEAPAPAAAPVAAPPAAAAPAADVVAWVGGEAITASEVEGSIAGEIARLRQEEYQARRNALDQIIAQRLIEKEAAARGIAPQELLRVEVESKAVPPTDEAVRQFFDANQAAMGGRSFEQVAPDIQRHLQQQSIGAIGNTFLQGLIAKADVKVLLEPPRTEVPIPAGEPSRGGADAKVTVVEFSDFQCPYCKRAHAAVEEIVRSYGERIRFVYRDYPLPNHPRAFPASEAARCAGDQGKYWEYHGSLMTVAGDLSDEDLGKRAADLGLDAASFSECLGSGRHEAAVRASAEAGTAAGVTGTPTFFVNGRMMAGAQPPEEFRRVIDEELRRGGAPTP